MAYMACNNTHQTYTVNDVIDAIHEEVFPVTVDGVPIRKLFVSNLAGKTTYKDLSNLFSNYGHVESCFLLRDERKNNYAFVTFRDVVDAMRARTEFIVLHKRNLRVMPADSWHQPDSIENQYYNIAKDWNKSRNKQCNELCSQSETENDNTSPSIHRLNDDCLIHIFLHLPIAYRIRIERVCKRWMALSQESWRNVKRLDVSYSVIWGHPPTVTQNDINTVVLRKILLRCGRFLNEISFSNTFHQLSNSTLTVVSKLCPNLQKIDVIALRVSGSGIDSLTKNCHSITKLSLGTITPQCDADLLKLFKANQNLEYFKLMNTFMCGRCLLYLPSETMEELILENCHCYRKHVLLGVMANLKNLKKLSIKMCFGVTSKVAEAIGANCKSLKTLEFSRNYDLMEPEDMLHITHLTNLEVLNVSLLRAVSDEFLINLASKCQNLTFINISGCTLITDNGLAAITSLPKLEVLKMSYLYVVNFTKLGNTCILQKLECRGSRLSDRTIINLLKCSPNLELLDLSGSINITNATLKAAAEITTCRASRRVLKIFVGGTSVDLNEFTNVSPFLLILNMNLSEVFSDFDLLQS